jgi:hypothetical protein
MPLQNVQRGPNVAGDSMSTSMTVTGSGTAHTKGAWTQIFASTTVDSGWVVLMPDDVAVSATNTATLVDIGVGAAGSERVVVADINVGGWGHGPSFQAPLFVPAGSRVAVRLQSAVVSKVMNGRLSLIPSAILGDASQFSETWGTVSASSIGLLLTTPSVSGTDTAWQQITAGITRDTNWVTFSLGCNTGGNIAASKGTFTIGYGASGSEQPLLANARWEQLGTETIRPCTYVVPCNLPAGTRLAIRWNSTSTAAGSAANASVHCFS